MSDFIIPPPPIIKIIETTVQTVAKWGEKLEKRIIEEKKDPKFSFLLPDDPFHPYYQMKLEEAKSGQKQKPVTNTKIVLNPLVAPQKPQKKQILSPLFLYQQPPDIGSLQLDVIHLTAQNVALYGRDFLKLIVEREGDAPLFAFLRPGKPYFRFFCSLCDQYRAALDPPAALRRRLEEEAGSLAAVKENLEAEVEHERETIAQKKKEAEEARAGEKDELYDWENFKILATIDYDEEVVVEPKEKGDVVARTMRKRHELEQISPITGQRVRVEEFGEHLRFEMQHPQYQKELATRKERMAEQNSALAKGDEMTANLKQFAKGESERVENAVIWDGRDESIKKVVAEAVLTLDEKKDDGKKEEKKAQVIGPVFD